MAEDPGSGIVDLRSLVQRLASIHPGEGRAVFWSFCYFFCLLSSENLIVWVNNLPSPKLPIIDKSLVGVAR